jgi:hypothetical protein
MRTVAPIVILLVSWCAASLGEGRAPDHCFAQSSPYENPPAAEPPYYRVRYEASTEPGELIFPVAYTVWVPPTAEILRGVIVHQHGCGEGSCKSGQTGAFDLHWQALARKHDCALLSPSYEQPDQADCQMWCDRFRSRSRIWAGNPAAPNSRPFPGRFGAIVAVGIGPAAW